MTLFMIRPSRFAPSMKERPRQDRDVQGDGKADHPFHQYEFGFELENRPVQLGVELENRAVDPGEPVVIVGEGFGGLARLVLRSAGGDKGIVDFRDHRRHGNRPPSPLLSTMDSAARAIPEATAGSNA